LHLQHLSQQQQQGLHILNTLSGLKHDLFVLLYHVRVHLHSNCRANCHRCPVHMLINLPRFAHCSQLLLRLAGSTQVTLNITTFNPSSQPAGLTVRVQRPATHASSDDIVALYIHPSDPRSTIPITWQNLTASSPSYPDTGSGSVTFRLLNFRQDFIVRLVGNGTFSPVVLAESAVVKNTKINLPGQVHLALHADGSSVVVQWVSGSAAPQQLQYSSTAVHLADLSPAAGSTGTTHARQYSSTTTGAAVVVSTARSYDRGMLCGEPATTFGFIHPGYMHTAVIPGTDAGHNRRLHYRCDTTASAATGCRACVVNLAAVTACCSR
jgi:hypothetical protein